MVTGVPTIRNHIKDVIEQFLRQFDNNSKPLQSLFTDTVAEIFGPRGKTGFNLHEIEYSSHPVEHDLVFKFLHPLGPFFKLCYKLVEDNCHLYYPISKLPLAVNQDINLCSGSRFYRSKLILNSETKELVSLLLNPFEYYIFQFVSYLVTYNFKEKNKKRQNNKENEHFQKASLYLRLCEEYITLFLPCGNTPVMPFVSCPVASPHSKICHSTLSKTLFSSVQKYTTYIRNDLQSNILEPAYDSSLHSENLSDEIWRSYLFLNITIDFWACLPISDTICADSPYLPSPDTICAVRYLLKHLHAFSNFDSCTHSKMDSFRREVFPLYQRKIYYFIRTTIIHWPHDTTFSLILETWLTYIQPWRYATPSTNSFSEHSSDQNQIQIGRQWMSFIRDNFLFYTNIFQLVLKHFHNANLSMLKNVSMLIRPLKVYGTSNLGSYVYEIESRYLCVKSGFIQNIKWAEFMQLHFNSLEEQSFQFTPVFSGDFLKEMMSLYELLSMYERMALEQSYVVHKEEKALSSFWNRWFSLQSDVKNDDNNLLLCRLKIAMQLLSSLFNFHPPAVEQESVMERSDTSDSFTYGENSRMISFSVKTEYTGDPDLLPIQSYEIAVFVRFFYILSSWINENYGDTFSLLYKKRGYIGLLARQLLVEPKDIVNLDKSRGIFRPLAVTKQLPPRLSLRFLANQLIYIYIIIFIFICLLIGIPVSIALAYLTGAGFISLLLLPILSFKKLQ